MAKYIAESRVIASVYPGQLTPIRRNYGASPQGQGKTAERSTLFSLPPCRDSRGNPSRKAKPVTLVIHDSFESVLDVMATGQIVGGSKNQKAYLAKPVPVEEIIADLLKEWTGGLFNVPLGASPGVIEIANTVPSASELNHMLAVQTAYFEYWFNTGEAIQRGDKSSIENYGRHTPEMILAAEWLGEVRNWSNPSMARNLDPCPWCQTLISTLAIFCPNCAKQVRQVPPELAALSSQPTVQPGSPA